MPDTHSSEPQGPASVTQETFSETLARWARQEEEARVRAGRKLAEVFARLREQFPEAQHRYLVAGYNGCGDQGCFEYIGFVATAEQAQNAETWDPPEGFETAYPEGVTEQTLAELLDPFLPGGYENNEGGQGVVRINLESGEVEVDHEHNVTDVVAEGHAYQLEPADS